MVYTVTTFLISIFIHLEALDFINQTCKL